MINAVDKTEILEKAEIKQISHTEKAGSANEVVEVKVTIAQLPTTQAIDSMIMNGQVRSIFISLVKSSWFPP